MTHPELSETAHAPLDPAVVAQATSHYLESLRVEADARARRSAALLELRPLIGEVAELEDRLVQACAHAQALQVQLRDFPWRWGWLRGQPSRQGQLRAALHLSRRLALQVAAASGVLEDRQEAARQRYWAAFHRSGELRRAADALTGGAQHPQAWARAVYLHAREQVDGDEEQRRRAGLRRLTLSGLGHTVPGP